MKLRLKSH